MARILFVDDDPHAQKTLAMVLDGKHEVIPAYSGSDGLILVRDEDPDLVLLDINLPDMHGIEVLRAIVAIPAPPPVLMMTILSDIKLVVSAIREGAYDYIVKPYEIRNLLSTIRKALEFQACQSGTPLKGSSRSELEKIIGESPSTRRMKELIVRFAVSGAPVIVSGASGTGKELVARAIHSISCRPGRFIALNCGALPETLIEAELFGTERGAYTDAVKRIGAFERAEGGSLFLDEIGDMPLNVQVKLLRALESGEIVRLGGENPIQLNVRIIAATHRNLRKMIKNRSLREDLYYRLSVLVIETAPLKERREDIPILSAFFLNGRSKSLTPEGLAKLENHSWPGNVRELRNVIERAALLSNDNRIRSKDIVLY